MNEQYTILLDQNEPILETVPTTDSEFDKFFTKIAHSYNITTFKDLEEKVNDLFHENKKVNDNLQKWANKLTLDRSRLKDVFRKY